MNRTFYYNGTMITMDSDHPMAANFLVEDGVIQAVDVDEEDIGFTRQDELTDWVVLQGRVVTPGFHDCLMHLVEYGYNQRYCVDLSEAVSAEDVVRRMRAFIAEQQIPAGSWIIGSRWNQEHFPDKRLLSREDLDRVSDCHYVFAKRVCIHIAAVNSKVLELAGIDHNTYLDNQNIGRYPDGTPDGRIYEDAIADMVLVHKPALSVKEIEQVIEETLREIKARGFTAVQCDDMKAFSDFTSKERILRAYDNLRKQQRLPVRVFAQIQVSSLEEFRQLQKILVEIADDQWFSWKRLKLILDGSLGAETAALTVPYRNRRQRGLLNFSDAELELLVRESYESGMQLLCHCIGDRAMEQAIRVITPFQNRYGTDCRPRLVHCQIATEPLLDRMAQAGILADIQPAFVPTDYAVAEQKLDLRQAYALYAWRTMLEKGMMISGSSDCPVERCDALYGMQAAVTRMDLQGRPTGGFLPEERLSPYEALALYTKAPAYTVKMEGQMGRIAPGYFGDFTVLDGNPLLVPPQQIHSISIVETHCGA